MVLRQDEIDAFQPGGSLVIDDRRRRPLYFDGRFLAARDLVREQNYFLTRQADIARFAGFGAMQGLMVRHLGSNLADAVTIQAGQGVTPSGELVIIPQDHTISLSNVPEDQRLNANFGLLPIPKEPSRNRSGLYVLGLRPVEFSANPIASYPTTITGPRTVHDGDIVEATAITLVPYADAGTSLDLDLRRAYAAREIFLSSALRGVPAGVLPLAMLGLNHGNVEWVDSYLVRREVGAEYGDLLRFGTGNRATQQAFILQYDAQLNEVLARQQQDGKGFPATQYFYALPPCGRVPFQCIDKENFTQSFFPQETNVSVSIVPSDELPSLIEQAVGLPPIDLMQPADSFANISILVLMPVPRQKFAQIKSKLQAQPLQPAIPTVISARKPLDLLRLQRGPLSTDPVFVPPSTTANAFWKDVVASPFAYYVRLRSAPVAVEITNPAEAPSQTVEQPPKRIPIVPPHPIEPPTPPTPKPTPEPPTPVPEPPKPPVPEPPKPPVPEPPKPPVPEPPIHPPIPEPPIHPPIPEPTKPPVPVPPHPPIPVPPRPPIPEPPKPPAPKPPTPLPPKPVPPKPPVPIPRPPIKPVPPPPPKPAPQPVKPVPPAPPKPKP